MKKFNKVITIELELDVIAQSLLNVIIPDFKHRELLVETIIGHLNDDNRIGPVYAAISGFYKEVDFKIGDVVKNSKTKVYYTAWPGDEKKHQPLEAWTVIRIDRYSKHYPLYLEGHYIDYSDGKEEAKVAHAATSFEFCSLIPLDEPEVVEKHIRTYEPDSPTH